VQLREPRDRIVDVGPREQPVGLLGASQEDLGDLFNVTRLLEQDNRPGRQNVDEQLLLLARRAARGGHDADALDLVGRALRVQVDLADALDGIAEELDPQRLRVGGRRGRLRLRLEQRLAADQRGVDVDDAAPPGELTRQVHGVDALEAAGDEPLDHGLGIGRRADCQLERAGFQR
jgi:hypothetical protein